MSKLTSFLIVLAAIVVMAPGMPASAALIASDNAADTVYNPDWDNGDNGGSGWGGGWVLSTSNGNPSNAGHFVFDSTANADGADNGNVGGASGDGDINTSSKAWGLYGNSGQTSNAVRPFSGSLNVGQGFNIDMDNGYLDGGATVGFGLQDSSGNNRLEVFFAGGNANYTVFGSAAQDSLIGYTDEGLDIDFLLTGTDSYSVKLTRKDGTTNTLTGTLGGTSGSGVSQVRLFNFNAGGAGSNNLYFNSIAVTPEPASLGVLALAGIAMLRRRNL